MVPELPSIALVTPSLNQGRFIRDTITSVLTQEYPRLEYSVQDGGSSDETLEVLRSFGDALRFRSSPDSGQSEAINRGLMGTQADILGYLNSDDMLLPGALEAVGRAFVEHPEVVLVFGAAMFVGERGDTLGPYPVRADAFAELDHACLVAQPATFFRRRVWEAVGPFDQRLQHAMDYDYWFRIRQRYGAGAVRHLSRPLAAVRLHADAKTVSAWGRALREIFGVVRRHTGYVSPWWCLSKWDHLTDGRSQITHPHPRPRLALSLALGEFLLINHPRYWWTGLGRPIARRLSRGAGTVPS